jgi:hypothetical protein
VRRCVEASDQPRSCCSYSRRKARAESFLVRPVESESKQGYSPFEGLELSGRVKTTFLGVLLSFTAETSSSPHGVELRRMRLPSHTLALPCISTRWLSFPQTASVLPQKN